MLDIKNFSKQFRGKKILDGVNLAVRRGEIAVLLGPSGVGKSTLLRVLNNLETLDQGSVTLDGKPIDLNSINQTHLVGMVFQHFNLFEHLTVLENITLALKLVARKSAKEAEAIACKLLTLYGLADKAQTYCSQLSGGQKQRLALARTLALEPKILCLDEPTSALDPMLTTYVAGNVKELAQQGYIILIATHDTTLLERLSCTIYLMKDGTIQESATSQDFYANKDAYPHIKRFVSGDNS